MLGQGVRLAGWGVQEGPSHVREGCVGMWAWIQDRLGLAWQMKITKVRNVGVCVYALNARLGGECGAQNSGLGPTALSPQPVSATWQQWPDSQRGYHHPTREAEVLSTRPGTKHNSVNTKARPWSFLVTLYKCTCVGPASGQRWVNLGPSGPRRLSLFTQVEGGTQRSHSSDVWAEAWRGRAQSGGSSVSRARFRHN